MKTKSQEMFEELGYNIFNKNHIYTIYHNQENGYYVLLNDAKEKYVVRDNDDVAMLIDYKLTLAIMTYMEENYWL